MSEELSQAEHMRRASDAPRIPPELARLRREVEIRRLSYEPTSDANNYGGTAAKVEALTSR